ncbi:hypothetical protein PIB30_023948 [Stylosanthes scabra]|uniref:Uncharacterized protein n=1 Tax=Stylosanthes scabra TaxID=79078 RepID=A0ABU6W949_9FABA|nr:hypothetical protein [Stylosanthes scabra]
MPVTAKSKLMREGGTIDPFKLKATRGQGWQFEWDVAMGCRDGINSFMATTFNSKSKCKSKLGSDPNLIRSLNLLNATGIGFQIGVIGDTAFQFLKWLSASSSPKAVSGFHCLAGACKNVRIRPYSIIIALVGAAYALSKDNDDPWIRQLQNIRDKRKQHMEGISPKNETLKERFCATALPTGFYFQFGMYVGFAAFAFHLFLRVHQRSPCCDLRQHVMCCWQVCRLVLPQQHHNEKDISYIADAIAAGLLSLCHGLLVAAALAGLTGSVEFFGSGLIKINYFLVDDDQAGMRIISCVTKKKKNEVAATSAGAPLRENPPEPEFPKGQLLAFEDEEITSQLETAHRKCKL